MMNREIVETTRNEAALPRSSMRRYQKRIARWAGTRWKDFKGFTLTLERERSAQIFACALHVMVGAKVVSAATYGRDAEALLSQCFRTIETSFPGWDGQAASPAA